ncbi:MULTISPECIES: acyl-CoA dehydrogenase family protein [Nonomuraea]|uniref:Acyl-CoA dehydrogenase family protein n=1 Tax=Nonomuraea ferruginea TaxID=46174 RepID=A0ABT4SY94_9ACTN|nr:acyl-CoA dehydrogenase family protein [Nonomuraea ferruginea]MDA0642227.1 acyl-CoA dehydrogenase family protein [Nonomuraea ferruginea]
MTALPTGPDVTPGEAVEAARGWIAAHLPTAWREAGEQGGPRAVRTVRTREEYRAWYPEFGASGLVAATWEVDYGGLGWSRRAAVAADEALRPYHLPRLNPLGLNLAAPALFAHGTEEQRRRFLKPITRAEEIWCQLFSEPGSGSDLASLSTRAELDGDTWVVHGQKVWTTWADQADYAVLLARTDPDAPKHQGITYFLLAMRQPGVEVRPLPHIGGEAEFFEVFFDGARVPDAHRLGDPGNGWRVAQATLAGERQMVSGGGSVGVDRIGGVSASHLVRLARRRTESGLPGGWDDPLVRARIVELWCEEQVRTWTNRRVRARQAGNLPPGPESSIGKVHGTDLNQRIQETAATLSGEDAIAWPGTASSPAEYWASMPAETRGMLRSRANTIEGGTTEVNKNVIAERVLGLPKDFDPYRGKPWRDLPRS